MTLLISLKQFSVDGNVSATDSYINKFLHFARDSHHSKDLPHLRVPHYFVVVRDLFREMLHSSQFVSQVHISDC